MSTSEMNDADLQTRLEAAKDRVESAKDRVDQFGQEKLEELESAYREFEALLERYEDQVVGDAGDYETNIEFQSQIAEFTKGISSNMLLYETFADCDEYLQQRYFNQSDFDHVWEQLDPVEDLVERIDEYEAARAEYETVRRELLREIKSLDQEISELDRLSRLGTADLDAPTERLREPIDSYNESVTTAFETFKKEATALKVISFLDAMEAYPLVEFESPPADLKEFIQSEPPGEQRISKLLEYAEYSTSKLEHYVEMPDRLKHVIGGRKTFLTGLDANPLRIEWPPPPAGELEWRCQELTSAVNRFAPAVVEELRTVEALPRTTDYDRLRDSILASEELTDAERKRIKEGSVESELEAKRKRKQELQAVLDSYPEL